MLGDGERREATVMFCDLRGYSAWMEEEEPEEVALVIDRIKRRSVQIVEAYGGIVNQFVGDEVVGLFGVHSCHEDDPCRAAHAALALHAFVRTLRTYRSSGAVRELRLHTGIETGIVYARTRDPRAGLYDVAGDAVNTAARMRSLAQLDEVLVGPSAHRRIAALFRCEARPAVTLRGKTREVTPYLVLEPIPGLSVFEAARARGLTGYVGRERELQALQAAWQRARAGHGQLICVEGAPGVGKTRLFYELKQHAMQPDSAVSPLILHGRCLAYGDVAPYEPFTAAIRSMLAGDDSSQRPRAPDDDAVIERLRALAPRLESNSSVFAYLLATDSKRFALPHTTGGEQLRDAIVSALEQLLCEVAQKRPVLVLLEDWHWADDASRDALRMIAPRVTERGVLIAVNSRPGAASVAALGFGSHLRLEALDRQHIEAMACDLMQTQTLPAGLPAFLFERTQGNPFFVEEVCRALLSDHSIVREASGLCLARPLDQLSTPPSVQSIVRARIERLDVSLRQTLRMASIVGHEFSLGLLSALREAQRKSVGQAQLASGDEALDASKRELIAALLELEALGLVSRNDTRSDGPDVAYRFKHAITQEVAYQSVPLEQRRRQHGFLAEAIERGSELLGREMQHETLAYHYGLSSRREKAIEYALSAADRAFRAFAPHQAGRLYRRAIEFIDAERSPTDELKRLRVDVTLSWMRCGVYNPAPEQVEALRVAYTLAQDIGYERGACLCLNWLGWTQQGLGNLTEAIEHTRGFLRTAEALNDGVLVAHASMNLGVNLSFAGEYDASVQFLRAGIEQRGRSDGTAHRYAQGTLALIAAERGDFAQAQRLIEGSLESATAAGQISMQAPLLVQRAMIDTWQGQFELGRDAATLACELAQRIEAQYIGGMGMFLQAYTRFMLTRAPTELERMAQAIEQLDQSGMRLQMSYRLAHLAIAALRVGDLERAFVSAQAALARAEFGDRSGELPAGRALAVVWALRGESDASELHVQRCFELAELRRSARELALVQFATATIRVQQDRREEALTLLEQARAGFVAMRMDLYVDEVRAWGESHGLLSPSDTRNATALAR